MVTNSRKLQCFNIVRYGVPLLDIQMVAFVELKVIVKNNVNEGVHNCNEKSQIN